MCWRRGSKGEAHRTICTAEPMPRTGARMAKREKARTSESGRKGPKIITRKPKPSDFRDVIEYYYRFYEEVKENPLFGIVLSHKRPNMSDERKWFSELLGRTKRGATVALVAEVDGHAVGLCEVNAIGRPRSEVSHRGELGIAVSSDYRGMGVGTALLRSVLGKCRKKFEVVELSVFSKNKGAKKLYESFGFSTYATRPHSIKRGDAYLDEDLMRLEV